MTDSRSPSSPAPSSETHISGVTWLLIRDGCVLMERCPKKAEKLGVGEWFIPGGKVEGDEAPFDALHREISEEWPGVRIAKFSTLPVVQGSAIERELVYGLFLMQPYSIAVRGEIPAHAANGVELRWTPIAEALASPVPQVRMMVAAAVESRAPSRGSEEELGKLLDELIRRAKAEDDS